MKTSELIGAQLDWAVAKSLNLKVVIGSNHVMTGPCVYDAELVEMGVDSGSEFQPSTDWSQGGPIIEREQLSVEPLYTANGLDCWVAYGHNLRYTDAGDYIYGSDNRQYGPTPLIAAMRCYVASKFGDEIEIPKELV